MLCLGVHLQLSPVNLAPHFSTRAPLHPLAMPMVQKITQSINGRTHTDHSRIKLHILGVCRQCL